MKNASYSVQTCTQLKQVQNAGVRISRKVHLKKNLPTYIGLVLPTGFDPVLEY